MPSKESGPFDPEKIFQLGIVVKNIDETVEFYQEVFGIGPFEIREVNYPNATYYGEKAGYRGKRAFAKLGPITFELIELIEGKTIHEAFLKERGEGLHHIGFEVKDLQKSVEEAERRGLKVIQGFTREDGSGFAYLDSDKIGGVIFELIQKPIPKP
ncbi:MAG: VOC family protein [Deltaproteobacteria bacterium]|nr:VOC family protein [Deltaproteobacteria bacterium]